MNWKKIIYLFFLFFIFGLINPKLSKAAPNLTCSEASNLPSEVVESWLCGDLNTAPNNCCTVGGGGEVPYCSSTCSSTKCSGKPAWTRWNVECTALCQKNIYTGVWLWNKVMIVTQSASYACSTADKWNSSDPTLLRAGLCSCATGGIYKACCDKSTGNLVNSVRRLVGGAYDADCPDGTMIWNGGANITKQWAIDTCRALSCTPNCAATDGGVCAGTTYTGNCGQSCTGTKPLDYTNGACGSANGRTYSTENFTDTSNVCASGTVQWTNGPIGASGCTWSWNCVGTTGTCGTGVTANCSATKLISGTNGVCGSANGRTYNTVNFTDTSNLCTSGTVQWTNGPNGIINNTWTWNCLGNTGVCGGTSGTTVNCSAIRDTAPTYSSMVVQNADGTTVVAETGGRNQICQTTFTNSSNPNLVRFVVTFTDLQGGGDINYAELGIGNKTYTATTFTVIGNEARAIFDVKRSDFTLPTNVLNIYVRAYDNHAASGVTSIAADTGRDFKFWDCNVPVSGTLFDGSAGTACPSTGFSMPTISTNLKSLMFTNGVGITIPMNNITPPTYSSGGNNFIWGKRYTPHFNSDLAMVISGSIKANNRCISGDINLENGSIVNPYADSPTLVADFSGVVDQDSWYQTVGGGLMANNLITNRVPVTCITNCAMSINGTINTNGIVASQLIDNTGGYPVDSVNKGSPNNWWINKNLAETNSEYSELLNQYFWKAGIGETFTGDKNLSEIGTTGINFVNGNLTVTNDNNVNSGQFLMVVVNGDITVQPEVTNLEGIFVSRNLNIGGSSATALTIEGMIKTTQNVRVNRTFIDKRTNNTTPAVRFVYRPDFIFSMPAAITKQLTKWQWGN